MLFSLSRHVFVSFSLSMNHIFSQWWPNKRCLSTRLFFCLLLCVGCDIVLHWTHATLHSVIHTAHTNCCNWNDQTHCDTTYYTHIHANKTYLQVELSLMSSPPANWHGKRQWSAAQSPSIRWAAIFYQPLHLSSRSLGSVSLAVQGWLGENRPCSLN